MAWFEELSPCDYFPVSLTPAPLAVGWLERGHPFPTGPVAPEVFARLTELLANPWHPPFAAAGYHECDLCLYQPEARGTRNLWIPGDRVLYVCPELVPHYMNAHGYAPPPEFCRAVLDCPPIRSMAYLKRLLECGGRSLVKDSRA